MNKMQLLLVSLLLPVFTGYTVGLKPRCKTKDGSLDITFGNHGKDITVVSDIGSRATGVVVLPCGRIVATGINDGSRFPVQADFTLVGYDSHGFLDTNFGNNGIVFTDFGTALMNVMGDITVPSNDVATASIVQTNCNGCDNVCGNYCNNNCGNNGNKIVVVGATDVLGDPSFGVARYNGDGSLDTTFGLGGTGVMPIHIGGASATSGASSVAIQADNKIVVAGFFSRLGDSNTDFAVVRLNCDGTLDTTFGCDHSGIVIVTFGRDSGANAVKIQKDGKIVVAGSAGVKFFPTFALARLTSNGRLDEKFGDGGKVLTSFSDDNTTQDLAQALVLIEDCGTCCDGNQLRIIAIGFSNLVDVGDHFALAGYTDKGNLAHDFGLNGLVTTAFTDSTGSRALAAVLERDCVQGCKIVVAGFADFAIDEEGSTQEDFALARYLLDGSLDLQFGMGGQVTTDFAVESFDTANAVALQQNGDIVAAGFSDALGGVNQFALARYKVCNSCCTPCGLSCSPCK